MSKQGLVSLFIGEKKKHNHLLSIICDFREDGRSIRTHDVISVLEQLNRQEKHFPGSADTKIIIIKKTGNFIFECIL